MIRNNLVYYRNNSEYEGRICLFDLFACSVEEIAKLHDWYLPYEVTIAQNKVNSYIHYLE